MTIAENCSNANEKLKKDLLSKSQQYSDIESKYAECRASQTRQRVLLWDARELTFLAFGGAAYGLGGPVGLTLMAGFLGVVK